MNLKLLSFVIFLVCVDRFAYADTGHVLYGERKIDPSGTELYFDKNGWIYPDIFISDPSLDSAQASLSNWYLLHPKQFAKLCVNYQCMVFSSIENRMSNLNDSLLMEKARRINKLAENTRSISFLIHGYRKSMQSINGEYTSDDDFRCMKSSLIPYQNSSTTYVDIHWDGMYGCCFSSNAKKNEPLFRLFETAQENAKATGIGLRKLLNLVNCNHVILLTHSLGAMVGEYCLFNIQKSEIPTPSQPNVILCMVAPAIGAKELDQHFMDRQPLLKPDNYSIGIVYNKHDFVLRKKDNIIGWFGPGVKRYGNTGLGCNHHQEAVKLQKRLLKTYPDSKISLFNLSALGKVHHARNYFTGNNMKEVSEWLYGTIH